MTNITRGEIRQLLNEMQRQLYLMRLTITAVATRADGKGDPLWHQIKQAELAIGTAQQELDKAADLAALC